MKERELAMDLVLASRSPRRQELLKKIIPHFRVAASDCDEEQFRSQDPVCFALRAAEAKAMDVGQRYPDSIILAADTVVSVDDEIMGKPKDRLEAKRMLEKLSGRRHRVVTAVALFKKNDSRLLTGYEISQVLFKPLSEEEIESYLATGDFADKAGAYAIQEIGDAFVAELEGDYDNVVGLPVRKVKRLLLEFLRPEVEAEITDLAFPSGWGVAAGGGVVTFIPGALPGDRVRIKVAAKKKRYNFGRVLRLESPSPFRVEPGCPHFGECGGCAFQNMAYEKQLEFKENYVLRTLRAIGKIDITETEKEPIVASPDLYFYRNKMEYAFGGDEGKIFLGLRARTSPLDKYEKKTIAIQKCPIFSPVVEEIFPLVADFARETGLPSYNPITRKGYFRNLVLREGKATGDVLAVLVTRSGGELDIRKLARKLEDRIPALKSFWFTETDRVSDVVDFSAKKHISGELHIEEKLAGLCFRLGPEDFFQPNPKAAEVLYQRLVREAKERGCSRALGLYCGPGPMEIFLSRVVREVVGIDCEPSNIARAKENCQVNGIRNCLFLEGRVEHILKSGDFHGFDLLVLDPPRSGLSGRALQQVLRLNVPTILYVSCNPAALARDLSLFMERGYRLDKITCFDFFPHTPHVECLAVIARP